MSSICDSIHKKIALCGMVLLACVSVFAGVNQASAKDVGEININPTPQEMEKGDKGFPLTPRVGIVVGEETDEHAVNELEAVLKDSDVKKINRFQPGEKVNTPVTIWVGGPSENEASANVLENMDVNGPEALKEEGYVLATGKNKIVLAGKDQTGTYYAVKSFKQLIQEKKGRNWIPQVQIRDWPEMPIRGSIEGFYGPPWTHEDRLKQIEFYGENKLNTYIYAPKDDPYHREDWREPYPEEELAKLKELIDKANENHVKFTFSVSPGETICYSGDKDFELLTAKMEKMWDLGVTSYAIFLDDISQTLNCEADIEKFGDDEEPVAAAHAYLLNRFNEEFIQTHEGAERLITVPTEYSGNGTTFYRERFAELLNQDTVVMWTGSKVVPEQVTAEGAEEAHNVFKHDLLLWDNYPVNDFDRNSLFLGPLVNRDKHLTEHGVNGVTANPMNEAEASKIPLFTIADYTWNPFNYDPKDSWNRSIESFGGDAVEALTAFAENSYSSPINDQESLTLKPLIDAFWQAYVSGENVDEKAADLIDEFTYLQDVPNILNEKMENEKFLSEIDPYLEKLKVYGEAGEVAVKYVMATKNEETEQANQYREELIRLFNQSEEIPQKMGTGVIKPFLIKSALELAPLELTLDPSIDQFWDAYKANDVNNEAEMLIEQFVELKQIPENIRQKVDNQAFLNSMEDYLNNLDVYGEAGEVAVKYVMAKKQDEETVSDYRDQLYQLMMEAYQMPQKVGDQVIKPFLIDSMWSDLNVVDYRMLDGVNQPRGGGELIQYTPEYGERTGTNQWGYEVTVVDGKVVKAGGSNSIIPENGYVLSIHANDWLRDNATIGKTIRIEDNVVLVTNPQ
ncbi:O-GlcNAcase NagJ precursor [Paraliobacillus sp. PM-2]|uniref:beta-N-acetylglucosaminidase domain-containing protein n=1 Tax=Paraliobacillus sp. PM-2 TaxID=1462524 RepID=UPI00061C78FB|nr:beta-N-acetylglucosaminidase domain-containing protein [Paraliobacillus sp. PM-2]CQR46311.1 O-GlcNAcase NagJ precursor [Paraliobacillus sp. PM-2]